MKLFKFVPIQLTLFLILGIILGFGLNEISLPFVFILLLIGIAFIAITHFYSSFFKSYATIIFQVLVAICMVLIGISSVFIHTETNYKKHYSNATKFSENTSNAVVLKIHKELKSTKTFDKYEAILLLFNGENLKGKLLLNVKKDSVTEKLKVDDEIALKSTFVAIQKAMNPFGFDYRQYLNNQQIYFGCCPWVCKFSA